MRNYDNRAGGRADNTPEPALDKIQKWITDGVDADAIVFAEDAGKYMANNELTPTQIRNVYGEIKRIQMKGFDKAQSSFYLLKPKVAYATKRKRCNGSRYFQQFFNEAYLVVRNKEHFEHFCELMEAVLAYHKIYSKK